MSSGLLSSLFTSRSLYIIGYFAQRVCVLKDYFWELVMLIYGNLTYLKNREISLDEIFNLNFRFLTGRWCGNGLHFNLLESSFIKI